jgi:hypothetical protein
LIDATDGRGRLTVGADVAVDRADEGLLQTGDERERGNEAGR